MLINANKIGQNNATIKNNHKFYGIKSLNSSHIITKQP